MRLSRLLEDRRVASARSGPGLANFPIADAHVAERRYSGVVMTEARVCRVMLACTAALMALPALAQIPTEQALPDQSQLLLSENAYNPLPSPDGKYIAYVATGWGRRRPNEIFISGGRSSLVSDVEIMDSSGKILAPPIGRRMFLAGWTPDSKAVICYRDWRYAVFTPNGVSLDAGAFPLGDDLPRLERATFLPDVGHAVWLQIERPKEILVTSTGPLLTLPLGTDASLIAPSPDGRYLALMGASSGILWIYDRTLLHWTNLGRANVSPSSDWDYVQPSWDPWFKDSSQLAFFSGLDLVICAPDGTKRRTLWTADSDHPAGLAAPSPNGAEVAFVTFQSRPATHRPDLKFWGNTSVSVISTIEGSRPRMLAPVNPDTTTVLRWLGSDSLVFDRMRENLFAMYSRIWRIAVH